MFNIKYLLLSIALLCSAHLEADCNLETYLTAPSFSKRLALLLKSDSCVEDWVGDFNTAQSEVEKTQTLQFVIHASGANPARNQLLLDLLSRMDSLTPLQLALVDFFMLTRTDESDPHFHRLVASLSNTSQPQWGAFPFDWYDHFSLKFFEMFVANASEYGVHVLHLGLQRLHSLFPFAGDELITALLMGEFERQLAGGEATVNIELTELVNYLTPDQRLKIAVEIMQNAPRELSNNDSIRQGLLERALADNPAIFSTTLVSLMNDFYFNSLTAPQPPNEGTENFGLRRSKMLSFGLFLEHLQTRGRQRFVGDFIVENLESIFISDLPEFTFIMRSTTTKLSNRLEIAQRLLASKQIKLINEGLFLVQLIPTEYWQEDLQLKDWALLRLRSLSRYTLNTTVNSIERETLRQNAAATLSKFEPNAFNYSSVLSGLGNENPEARIHALRSIERLSVLDAFVVEQLVEVLRRDPAKAVRLQAVETVLVQLEDRAIGSDVRLYYHSLPMGVALMSAASDEDEWQPTEMLQKAIDLYVRNSPHAWEVIKLGLSSSNEEIKKMAKFALGSYSDEIADEFGELTFRLYKLAPSLEAPQIVQSELPSIIYRLMAAVLVEYGSEGVNAESRIERFITVQQAVVDYIRSLKSLKENTVLSEEQQIKLKEMLDELEELLK